MVHSSSWVRGSRARIAFIAQPPRGRIFDLHETVALAMNKARIVAAFAHHRAMNEVFRHAVSPGLPSDDLIVSGWPRRRADETDRTRSHCDCSASWDSQHRQRLLLPDVTRELRPKKGAALCVRFAAR